LDINSQFYVHKTGKVFLLSWIIFQKEVKWFTWWMIVIWEARWKIL